MLRLKGLQRQVQSERARTHSRSQDINMMWFTALMCWQMKPCKVLMPGVDAKLIYRPHFRPQEEVEEEEEFEQDEEWVESEEEADTEQAEVQNEADHDQEEEKESKPEEEESDQGESDSASEHVGLLGLPASGSAQSARVCAMCGQPLVDGGHNGYPLVRGQVCSSCDQQVALARVVQLLINHDRKQQAEETIHDGVGDFSNMSTTRLAVRRTVELARELARERELAENETSETPSKRQKAGHNSEAKEENEEAEDESSGEGRGYGIECRWLWLVQIITGRSLKVSVKTSL